MIYKPWTERELSFNLIIGVAPFKVICTRFGHGVMENTHCAHHTGFGFCCTCDVKLWKEIISDSDQSIFRPAGKPIHSAAADEPRELQRSIAEFLTDLAKKKKKKKKKKKDSRYQKGT